MSICSTCSGAGAILKATDKDRFLSLCSVCRGSGIEDHPTFTSFPDHIEHKMRTLAWVASLKKTTCYSCGGNPWSAEDGCGTCSHHGYHYIDEKTDEWYKRYQVERISQEVMR